MDTRVSAAEDQSRREAELRAGLSHTESGICDGYDLPSQQALVNVNGVPRFIPWIGEPPWRGGTVRILRLGGGEVATAIFGSAMGTVVSITDSQVTVTGDDTITYVYADTRDRGVPLTSGDRVRLDHPGKQVGNVYATEPIGSDYDVPTPPPTGGKKTMTFRPIDSGSYRAGSYRGPLVEVNESRTGYYWYGTQIFDTIAGKTITKLELTLSENYDYLPGLVSLLGVHGAAGRSDPGISGSIPVSGSGVFDLMGFAAQFSSGSAKGVGFQIDTGYRAFDSFATSGTIYAEYN